jgi:DNA-binding transcriptional LysR family regulator
VRNIDPRLFRNFLAVAQELHFGRAAARLYVAQQALSRDIARLERELGVPLFVRSTRRVARTVEGERLVPRAAEFLALHDGILDEMRGSDQSLMVDALRVRSTASGVLSRLGSWLPIWRSKGASTAGSVPPIPSCWRTGST